jgi:hypothetical protein
VLTPTRKGNIAEMAIAAAATKLDIGVLKPLGEGERYDLVLDMRPRLLRVQCKWGRYRKGVVIVHLTTFRRTREGYKTTTYCAAEVDAIGVYCAPLDCCYLLPISLADGRRALQLRVEPSKNNQRALVNWAHDYELGAIAQLGERRRGTAEAAGSSPASSTSEATAPAVASLFQDPPPVNSSNGLRTDDVVPITRAVCEPSS